jgi:predicted PurR-regulated permease PerM
MEQARVELAKITLSVIFIGGLIAGSLWILQPFLGALIWAAMIVIATWPALLALQGVFRGRRGPAIAILTLLLLAVLVVPLALLTEAALKHVDQVPELATRLAGAHLPSPPGWLARIPIVGERMTDAWQQATSTGLPDLASQAKPYLRQVASWFGRQVGSFGLVLVQFLLTVVLCAVLYSGGEAWAAWIRRFARRLAGQRGDRVTLLAGAAIRSVALGVVVTAILQSVLGGIGLAVAGVPFAAALTIVMFVLCIAQLGPILILLPATIWVYYHAGSGWGTFLLIWSLVVGLMDNFVRPALIRRGADLPFLLVFAGVVGGLMTFGLIGIFAGPVILAVAYTLLSDWIAVESEATSVEASARPAVESMAEQGPS